MTHSNVFIKKLLCGALIKILFLYTSILLLSTYSTYSTYSTSTLLIYFLVFKIPLFCFIIFFDFFLIQTSFFFSKKPHQTTICFNSIFRVLLPWALWCGNDFGFSQEYDIRTFLWLKSRTISIEFIQRSILKIK